MKRNLARASIAVVLLTFGTGMAWAQTRAGQRAQGTQNQNQNQKKMRNDDPAQAEKRQKKLRQVSGVVLQTKMVEVKGTDSQNLVALIKTTKNDHRLLVDLGPQNELPSSIVPGERIAAEGVVVRLGDHQILIARRAQDDGKTFEIDRVAQIRQRQGQTRQR